MKALLFSAVCHRLHSALLPPFFWWRSHISKSPFHKFLPAVLFAPLHFHVLALKLLCSASSSALWVKLINGGSLANVLYASFSTVTDQSHCSHFLTHLVGFLFIFRSQIHIHTHTHSYFCYCEAFNRHELLALTLTPTVTQFYPNLQPRLMAGLLRTIKVSLVVGLNHRSTGQVPRHSGWRSGSTTSSDQPIEMQQEVVEASNAKCYYMWIKYWPPTKLTCQVVPLFPSHFLLFLCRYFSQRKVT